MTVEFRERPVKVSQSKPQVGDLLAREFNHESVFIVGTVARTRYIFAGALEQLSQQK